MYFFVMTTMREELRELISPTSSPEIHERKDAMSVFHNISRFPIKNMLSIKHSLAQTPHKSVTNSKKLQKLKDMQIRMQSKSDHDVPVFLKKGTPDKILFQGSGLLIIAGLILSVQFIWKHAMKPS